MRSFEQLEVETAKGIVGDRYHGARHRQVTIQSQASLDEASDVFGSLVPAALTRRTPDAGAPLVPAARVRAGQGIWGS